jgi:flagellum-specific ATP synthase
MSLATVALVDQALIDAVRPKIFGSVLAVDGPILKIAGLNGRVRVGDRLAVLRKSHHPLYIETLGVSRASAIAFAFGPTDGVTAGDRAELMLSRSYARPSSDWFGRILNWRGESIDGTTPDSGARVVNLDAPPISPALRRPIGVRLRTGLAAFDTFLPLCRGQRIGVFAGSGVGKSSLLGELAAGVQADVCVIALIGERGREVKSFAQAAQAAGYLGKTIIIASTSDEPALVRRESARLAMATAEYFRDEGKHVLLIFDSLTRYAESHREIALARGEPPSLHAYPPSTVSALASVVERAGPGAEGHGDITAIFSVLVAGSDMDEPVADMVRGLLDGHVILDRAIAERGRYPAINVRRSVSRSLPGAASAEENVLLLEARALLAAYENAEMVVRAGLYAAGSDAATDRAIAIWPRLDPFIARGGMANPDHSFDQLRQILASA